MFSGNKGNRYAGKKALTHQPMDRILLLLVLILIGVGCFFIDDFTVPGEAAPSKEIYLIQQLLWGGCSYAYLRILSTIDYHYLDLFSIPMTLVLLAFLILVVAAGPSGVIQWQVPRLVIETKSIPMGPLTEIAGLSIFATLLSRIDLDRSKWILFNGCALCICGLTALISGLTAALVLVVTLYILNCLMNEWGLVTGFTVLTCICEILWMGQLTRSRLGWLDPFADAEGEGFAAVQSIYAIAQGGMLGVGVGNGAMCHTVEGVRGTYMLPAIVQEIGLLGAAGILLIYLLFLVRAYIIAVKAADRFGFYLAAAIVIRFSVLFALVLLCSVNVFPRLENLTLPFLSYGGVSLTEDCVLTGILLSVGRYQAESVRR